MCKKCEKNPRNRNTRYCDDWWDDITSHGGRKADRKKKRRSIYDKETITLDWD